MMQMGGAPQIMVLNQNTRRESGRKVQMDNIRAAKAVADIIRTCLGPRAMLKMLLNPIGNIVLTNDGNAVLRELTVQHPAAKTVIEISRTQDEEVGDGTTSVIVLAGEFLAVCAPFLEQNVHPTVIISALRQALEDMVGILKDNIAKPVDLNDQQQMIQVVRSCIGTKMLGKWGDFACQLALDAVKTVYIDEHGRKEIDIKKYAKIEKVPGGDISDSRVLNGVMLNKDIVHPKMRRRIENPRIVLLDGGIEYK
jgi:T-complex protein 1 subunit gamma